jgi:hypothetical protein
LLGAVLTTSCFLVLLDIRRRFPPTGLVDQSTGTLYGYWVLSLILGLLTLYWSFRGIHPTTALLLAWAAVVVKVGTILLFMPWARPAPTLALAFLTGLIRLLVVLTPPCLLGIAISLREQERSVHAYSRPLAIVLAAGLAAQSLWIGVESVLSAMNTGLAQWSSPVFILDSVLVSATTVALAWACVEELRPRRGASRKAPHLFRAMMVWLLAVTLHEAYGLYLSLFVFQRPFTEALPRVLPEILWTLILIIATACAFTPQAVGYNSGASRYP